MQKHHILILTNFYIEAKKWHVAGQAQARTKELNLVLCMFELNATKSNKVSTQVKNLRQFIAKNIFCGANCRLLIGVDKFCHQI